MMSFTLDRLFQIPVLVLTVAAITFICSTIYADWLPGSKPTDAEGREGKKKKKKKGKGEGEGIFEICGMNCCGGALKTTFLNLFPRRTAAACKHTRTNARRPVNTHFYPHMHEQELQSH